MSGSAVFERDRPRYVESATGRLAKYPANAWRRWGLRLLIALPYVAVAIAFDIASKHTWAGTPDADLAHRVGGIAWGTPGVDVVGALYPPITSILALVIPGGAFGLGIAGALVAGLMLQLIVQSLVRKRFPAGIVVVFALTLALSPSFVYIVTTNFETVLGLTFFGLGMVDLVRFVTFANTQAGFRAGILFACSAFSDTTGLFTGVVAAVAGALLTQSRNGARWANTVVVVFPTAALFGALALLGIAFGAGPLAMIRGELHWSPARAESYQHLILSPGGILYLAPTIIVIVTSFALRRPAFALVAVLLTAMIGFSYVVNLTPPGAVGANFVMLLLLVVAIVPTGTTYRHALITVTTSVLLFASGIGAALQREPFVVWLHVITGGAR